MILLLRGNLIMVGDNLVDDIIRSTGMVVDIACDGIDELMKALIEFIRAHYEKKAGEFLLDKFDLTNFSVENGENNQLESILSNDTKDNLHPDRLTPKGQNLLYTTNTFTQDELNGILRRYGLRDKVIMAPLDKIYNGQKHSEKDMANYTAIFLTNEDREQFTKAILELAATKQRITRVTESELAKMTNTNQFPCKQNDLHTIENLNDDEVKLIQVLSKESDSYMPFAVRANENGLKDVLMPNCHHNRIAALLFKLKYIEASHGQKTLSGENILLKNSTTNAILNILDIYKESPVDSKVSYISDIDKTKPFHIISSKNPNNHIRISSNGNAFDYQIQDPVNPQKTIKYSLSRDFCDKDQFTRKLQEALTDIANPVVLSEEEYSSDLKQETIEFLNDNLYGKDTDTTRLQDAALSVLYQFTAKPDDEKAEILNASVEEIQSFNYISNNFPALMSYVYNQLEENQSLEQSDIVSLRQLFENVKDDIEETEQGTAQAEPDIDVIIEQAGQPSRQSDTIEHDTRSRTEDKE